MACRTTTRLRPERLWVSPARSLAAWFWLSLCGLAALGQSVAVEKLGDESVADLALDRSGQSVYLLLARYTAPRARVLHLHRDPETPGSTLELGFRANRIQIADSGSRLAVFGALEDAEDGHSVEVGDGHYGARVFEGGEVIWSTSDVLLPVELDRDLERWLALERRSDFEIRVASGRVGDDRVLSSGTYRSPTLERYLAERSARASRGDAGTRAQRIDSSLVTLGLDAPTVLSVDTGVWIVLFGGEVVLFRQVEERLVATPVSTVDQRVVSHLRAREGELYAGLPGGLEARLGEEGLERNAQPAPAPPDRAHAYEHFVTSGSTLLGIRSEGDDRLLVMFEQIP
ncbi:MAG: hypothetical protein DWQ36_05960 [Acidobacteria bacterium]|nr:MAG: hypothetical protein DWQ30_18965 [Acidobacteriota bacterium]REK09594.1 MAG: hypothetical protein DWQ36_05960 [Acidobacteriota bacterium]